MEDRRRRKPGPVCQLTHGIREFQVGIFALRIISGRTGDIAACADPRSWASGAYTALCALDEMAITLKIISMRSRRSLIQRSAHASDFGVLHPHTPFEAPLIIPLRTTTPNYEEQLQGRKWGDKSAWFLWLRGSRLAKTARSAGLKVRDFVAYDRDLDLHQLKCLALCAGEALVERGWNEDIKQSGRKFALWH